MGKDFSVTIIDPERAAEWTDVLGTTTVNVVSPLPSLVNLPGHPRALAFFLDIKLLSGAQRAALVNHLANKFGEPAADVEAAIAEDPDHAVPILDKDCIMVIQNPWRWF